MWMFTTFGFFSVVKGGKGEVQVRARSRAHLEALSDRMKWQPSRILRTTGADYLHRIIVSPKEWKEAAAMLAVEAEKVTNFKSAADAARGLIDPLYVAALHDIWSVMNEYQHRV